MAQRQKTILIIEDERGFRRIYEDIFLRNGFRVLLAEDGKKGWHLVEKERPDLVLLDLILPKINGFDILRNIRTNLGTKNIPVLILSVLGEEKDKRKGFELGADDYAVKGYYSPKDVSYKARRLIKK